MRIEEILEQVLFENFNQLANLYDEVYDFAYERSVRTSSNLESSLVKISRLAQEIGLNAEHPAEVYAVLVRKNQPILDYLGEKDNNVGNVNYWNSQFSLVKTEKDHFNATETLYIFNKGLIKTLENVKEKKDFNENKDNYDVLHKGDDWILFEPHHKAASCRLGNGTDWCISSRGDRNYFDQYSENYDIYIIHTSNDKYAIIVNPNAGIVEVQDSDNEWGDPSMEDLREFMARLRKDGVDLNVLFDKLGLNKNAFRNFPQLKDFEIKDTGSANVDGVNTHDINMAFGNIFGRETITVTFMTVSYNGQLYFFTADGNDPNSINHSFFAALKNAIEDKLREIEMISQNTEIPQSFVVMLEDEFENHFLGEGFYLPNLYSKEGIQKMRELSNEN